MSKPRIPKSLTDPVAIQAYRSICDDLDAIGTLADADQKLITLYATDYALFVKVQAQLATTDLVTIGVDGRAFKNPLIETYVSLSRKLQLVLNDLGLTPSARKAKPQRIRKNPFKADSEGI